MTYVMPEQKRTTEGLTQVCANINILTRHIHDANVAAGWWSDGTMNNSSDAGPGNLRQPHNLKYVIPTKLALAHSELSAALEGFRKGLNDDHLPTRPMIEVELADAIIRILDIAGALNLDVGGALVEKFNYNQTRPDHKKEAREAEGGKSI